MRLVYVNEARTILAEVFTNDAVGEIIEAEVTSLTIARRPSERETWGPPVTLFLEGGGMPGV